MKTLRPGVRAADLGVASLPPKTSDRYYAGAEWRDLREKCLRRDGYRCVICGKSAVVADHVVSRKAGGPDALSNLRSLCRLHDNRLRERAGAPRGEGSEEGV